MRIAMLTKGYPPELGGVESHVEAIATRLSEQGDEVTVLTHGTGDRVMQSVASSGVNVIRFPLSVSQRHFQTSKQLFRHVRQNAAEYDVIHSHNYHATPALAAQRVDSVPHVLTPHYHGRSESAVRSAILRGYRVAGNQMVSRCAQIICVSEAERGLFVSHFPAVADRVRVIPNGVHRAEHTVESDWPSEPRINGEDLLSIGRLDTTKRVDRVIRLLPGLPERSLHVIGDGPARSQLTELAGQLAVANRVHLHGRVARAQLDYALEHAGVLVCLGKLEAYGLVLAEGLAAGTRVIGSDIPAHRDVVAEAGAEGTAVLCDPDDEAALRDSLVTQFAAARPEPSDKLSTWDDVTARTRETYECAIRGTR